jgi:hypothetical protein
LMMPDYLFAYWVNGCSVGHFGVGGGGSGLQHKTSRSRNINARNSLFSLQSRL